MGHKVVRAGVSEKRAEMRVKALKLRQVGHTYRVIGELLACSAVNAHNLVDEALKELAAQSMHEAASLRVLEMSRLDEYMLLLGPAIAAGDLTAMDRAIKINESRRKLLGIDRPVTQIQVNFTPEQIASMTDAELDTHISRFTPAGAGTSAQTGAEHQPPG